MPSLTNHTFTRLRFRATVKAKSVLRRIMPASIWNFLRRTLGNQDSYYTAGNIFAHEWWQARQTAPRAPAGAEMADGINLVGYLSAAKGIGEAARNNLTALQAAGIPVSPIDFEVGVAPSLQTENISSSPGGTPFAFRTNLIHVHPPQMPFLWGSFRHRDLAGHYNIGVWYWELAQFPDEWCFAFGLVDEVWAASQFIYDSVSEKSPVPVVKIPPCVAPVYDPRLTRKHFRLPQERFLFLCAYDMLSRQIRKNPFGAIEAFKRAFRKDDPSAGLVIKVINARENPDEIQHLRNELKGYSNCFLIENILHRAAMHSLVNLSDAYVSLHRSEGFGLVGAESMYLGKPVIMTRWSGNVDYMTEENSCGVAYSMIPVGGGAEPYHPSSLWAEPNVDQAAAYMQRLVEDRSYYENLSRRGARTIRDQYSPRHVGELIRDRLHQISLL